MLVAVFCLMMVGNGLAFTTHTKGLVVRTYWSWNQRARIFVILIDNEQIKLRRAQVPVISGDNVLLSVEIDGSQAPIISIIHKIVESDIPPGRDEVHENPMDYDDPTNVSQEEETDNPPGY